MPYDAVIVGSGPNGLSAAITLAQAGRSVLVVEGADAIGGGLRSAELTLPGFIHDVCSAVHPLGVASPFFRSLDLEAYGLRWVYPPAALAHPLDDGSAILLTSSVADTAARLDADADAYRRLMGGLTSSWPDLIADVLGPLGIPRNPLAFARFGLLAMQPASALARRAFRGVRARALLAGLAAHSTLPLSAPFTSGFGLVLGLLGHVAGPAGEGDSWPVAEAAHNASQMHSPLASGPSAVRSGPE
jgi:phytoene dehydrogenase-like protein